MGFIETFIYAGLSAVIVAGVAFIIGKVKGRYDVVDAAWGWMFVAPGWLIGGLHGFKPYALVVALVVTMWGMRLSYHIVNRIRTTNKEDERYTEIRSRWPEKHMDIQVFGRIYLVQALLATIISIPVIGLAASSSVVPWLLALGLTISIAGIVLETIADVQLRAFLRQPENSGKLMKDGLWKYSRHPNYFGEVVMWWGMGIAALGSSIGVIGFIGPLVITFLLLYVSGVPLAEQRSAKRPGWVEYKRKTPVLVPFVKL